MADEKIISTNAFEAYRTMYGIRIEENTLAYRKTGFLLFVVGAVSTPFSFVIAEVPFKKVLMTILHYGLFYGGLVALIGGIVYLLFSFNVIKKKSIEFDTTSRNLKHGRRTIPFDKIQNVTCQTYEFFGKKTAKVRFKKDGINTPLIGPPTIVKESFNEIIAFVEELNGMVKK